MISKVVQRYLVASAIGVAAVAGTPHANATLLTLSDDFLVTVSDSFTVARGDFDVTGTFSDSASQGTSFAQFNDMGGALVLNSVTISVVTTAATQLTASVSSLCDEQSCSADATNTSTFSVGLDAPSGGLVEYALSPANQNASLTAMTDCNSSTQTCLTVADSKTLTPPNLLLSNFVLNSPVQLTNFVGSGSISVIPEVVLAGGYNASTDNSTLTASTTWAGSISVTYDYATATSSPGVPEPSGLLLIGTAIAALGFYKPRSKRS